MCRNDVNKIRAVVGMTHKGGIVQFLFYQAAVNRRNNGFHDGGKYKCGKRSGLSDTMNSLHDFFKRLKFIHQVIDSFCPFLIANTMSELLPCNRTSNVYSYGFMVLPVHFVRQ